MIDGSEVDGRDRNPGVSIREIHLDSDGHPGASKSDGGLSNRRIEMKHLLAAELVLARVEMAAQVWQHDTQQVLVFDTERAPGMINALFGESHSHRVGVNGRLGGVEEVEVRIWIGEGFFVGWEQQAILPDAHLAEQER